MNTDKIYAEHIANEYAHKETSKAVKLRKLDAKVKRPAYIFAYSFGVVFALILGIGMCLCMGQIGDGSQTMFIVGVIIGVFGIIGVCLNYPLYSLILKKRKDKYAYEVVELAKEISDK